ncbi:MAG: acyl carrier protein [Bacilli bacterium]|nr:acyl carrier protein [Bacilli bacterium]
MAGKQIEQIKKLFCERLAVADLDENKSLEELGLDSLDVVDMCLDVEDKFGVHFETEELVAFKTVKDLFEAIEKKLGE